MGPTRRGIWDLEHTAQGSLAWLEDERVPRWRQVSGSDQLACDKLILVGFEGQVGAHS